MKPDPEQEAALAAMQSGRNVFLTGLAGTGKSYTVQQYVGQSFRSLDVTATTGIAAINLQDAFLQRVGMLLKTSTVYRWAGINIGPRAGESFAGYFRKLQEGGGPNFSNACKRIRRAETLLIDEISMLPGRILDYLNFHMQEIRGNRQPFGGVQLIVVGDFLQLPPVARDGRYDWAFLCDAWRDAGFHTVNLNTIHRQNERDFIDALNDFREGRIRGTTAHLLSRRVARFPDRTIPRLFTHNTMVDKWNNYQLELIDHPERVYQAREQGAAHELDFLKKNMITPTELHLKDGARVMVTRNLTNKGELIAANGATGTVRHAPTGFGGVLRVALDNGSEIDLEPYEFQFDPTQPGSATLTQYPLRPAYAMTIHKSQGLTLDRALIDIRAAREPGQAYVALSRLSSLSGLWLKDWISGVFVSPDAINFYREIQRTNAA